MATFKTKPRDEQLSFVTSCHKCHGELTISNGRPDAHQCRERQPVTLADIRLALESRTS